MTFKYNGLLLAGVMAIPSTVLANNEDAFSEYLKLVCTNPQGDFARTCAAATIPPGSSGAFLEISNAGVMGATARNATGVLDQSQQAIEERADESRQQQFGITFDRWGLFGSVQRIKTTRDYSDIENGFDSKAKVLTGGVDYRVTSDWLLGAIVSQGETELEFNPTNNYNWLLDTYFELPVGSLETEYTELLAFSNYQFTNALYANAYAGWGEKSYKSIRNVDVVDIHYIAHGDYESDQVVWGFGVGYALFLGPVSIDAIVKLDSQRTKVERYNEVGGDIIENLNLQYRSQEIESLIQTLGLISSLNISFASAVIAPYIRIEVIREYQNDAREITSRLVSGPLEPTFILSTEAPDRNYKIVGGGVQLIARKGMQFFVDMDRMISHDYLSMRRVNMGFRLEL